MEVCCLKMASRCKPRDGAIHGSHLASSGFPQHDCGSLARVVMVRKTDQRMINTTTGDSGNPQCKVVTMETVQTYRGHKPDKTFVTKMTSESSQSMPKTTSKLESDLQKLSLNDGKPGAEKATPVRKISAYSKFELECLEAHNEYRAKHGVPALKLNKKLCKFADEWAKVIALRGTPVHRSNSPYGENIFCAWSSGSDLVVNGREPVENWYSEITSHTFGKEPVTLKSGHFTQVVWADSRELGVAQAKNRSGQIYVVANYDPPGNFIGSFAKNVHPLGFSHAQSLLAASTSSRTSAEPKSMTSSVAPADGDFTQQILKHHNELRRKHGAADMKLNEEINRCAQEWAETLAREDRFAHRPNCKYGENIYCLWSSDCNAQANPKEVCRSWYDEIKEYEFGVEPRGTFKAGHFTQLIWKASLELGVGVAKTQKGKVLVVCNYHPRGNFVGQFAKNVVKPTMK